MARARLPLAATALLALLLVAPAASANQANTAIAFSDSRPLQSLEVTQQVLASQRGQVCKRAGRPRAMSLRAARRSVGRYLRRKVGRRALRRLARNRQTRTAQRAENFAVAALGANSPGAALAALLIANRKAPRSGRHLISASGLLGPLGRANEAIAFAKAGERKARRAGRRGKLTPLGVPQRAFALNARGYALITLGRHAQAVKLLRRAARSEPLFSEPRRNLAAAHLCQGRTSLAAQTYRRAVRRQDLGETIGGPDGLAERYSPEKLFDLSHGAEAELPPIEYPATPEAAAAAHPAIDSQWSARRQEAHELRMKALGVVGTSPNFPDTTAGVSRWTDLRAAIDTWPDDPALKAGIDDIGAKARSLSELAQRHFDEALRQFEACEAAHPDDFEAEKKCSRDYCIPATAARHEQWLPAMRRLDEAMRAWGRDYYRRQTGLAANFADGAWRDLSVLWAQAELLDRYALHVLLEGSGQWTFVVQLLRHDCVNAPEGEGGEIGGHGLPSVPACPDTLNALSLSLNLVLFSLSVNCEQVSAKVGKPVGGFGSVSYRFGSGETTVYAGVQANAAFASADSGIYISFDAAGNVSDLGARATTGGSAGAGPISVSAGGKSLNWSFAPALL